ncbi:MAG: hypothetical protein MUF20_05810 [Methylotetracoccus sp.]|jgi:hypothetical protein|nr:hypothetical protein [Methylotetracoccus sp.]
MKISKVVHLQSMPRRYVQHFITTYRRSGVRWEWGYRVPVLHSDQYLLTFQYPIKRFD